MGQGAAENIVLTGFSYTGKSVVGREVAKRLGWRFIDTDDEIVSLAGKAIAEIFAQDGEQHFRELERQVLERSFRGRTGMVIATGGGAIVAAENRALMRECGVIICLEARPDTIYHRLLSDAEKGQGEVRPLLAVSEPEQHIRKLKDSRQPYYALADWTVHTDNLTVPEVCQEVLRGWAYCRRRFSAVGETEEAACLVTTSAESYPVLIGWDLLPELGKRLQELKLSESAYIISDDGVFPNYGAQVINSLERFGFAVKSFVVPQGEKSKSIEVAIEVYNWLVAQRAERSHIIIALGGGMVGDLAGFVAATYLRGLPLVQVPTSLMAMVDSAIGGKVAVDHPQAKNIIGAFYQPRLVLGDIRTLKTLPPRELVSGWAEVIKHAMILAPGLLEFLEAHLEELLNLEPETTAAALRRSAAIKSRVVSEDETEKGRRTLLNYGHTIGHALEAATGYERLFHGEAIAIGMMGAARLSQRLGLLPEEMVKRQQALLQGFGLPTAYTGVDITEMLQAMELDKKVRERALRWVLLEGIGQAVIRDDVPRGAVLSVLQELLR